MLTSAIRIEHDAIYPLHVAVNLTGLNRETLRKAIREGKLPATKRGKFWLIPGRSLAAWLTESSRQRVE